MLKQVVAIMKDSPQVPKDFEWCCRPILKTLNIFGIPLRIRESNSNCFWIIYFIGWILYCLNVTSCLIITFLSNETSEHQPTSVNQQIRSTAWQWNTGVDRYNTVCSLIVTHTVLLAITTVRWKDLVRVLHRMEQCQQFTSEEFQEFRTTFQIGLSICILGCLAVTFLVFYALMLDLKWWQILIYALQRSMVIFLCLAIITFCCFGWIASAMLNSLGKEIGYPTEDCSVHMDTLIAKWNRHYLLIIDYVHQLNRCFGCLLLVLVAPAFVRVINTSFYVMIEIKGGQWTIHATISLILLLCHFIGFTVVVNIPHKIRTGAINLTRKLRRLHFDDFSIQNQINVFTMEISNSLPKISAAGFFDVDLQLIPTLIGTTLTYLIILFQFQTSEKT